jgi:hypothetical protein
LTPLEVQAKGRMKHAMVSRKGLVPYNKNKVNQDRYVLKYAIGDDPGVSMFGVADGHGEYGHYVAAFVQENLPICLAAEKGMRKDPEGSITRATAAMCKRLNETDINCAFSGSTLVFGVRIDDTLYVANVGEWDTTRDPPTFLPSRAATGLHSLCVMSPSGFGSSLVCFALHAACLCSSCRRFALCPRSSGCEWSGAGAATLDRSEARATG